VQLKVGGKFHFNPKNVTIPADDVLLLAGGIGINPLHSMMSHIADVNTYPSGPYKGKILLLYSARTYCDLIWKVSGSSQY
jgi:ferredoxin-NADP reductase